MRRHFGLCIAIVGRATEEEFIADDLVCKMKSGRQVDAAPSVRSGRLSRVMVYKQWEDNKGTEREIY